MQHLKLLSLLIAIQYFAAPVGFALPESQSVPDILTSGVTVRGKITSDRMTQKGLESVLFFVTADSATSMSFRLLMKHAINDESVTSTLYRQLLLGGSATVRLADRTPIPSGTGVREEQVQGVLMCQPEPARRDSTSVTFALRCLNANTDKWVLNASGGPVFETDLLATAPNQSSIDQFIGRHAAAVDPQQRIVFVRLER